MDNLNIKAWCRPSNYNYITCNILQYGSIDYNIKLNILLVSNRTYLNINWLVCLASSKLLDEYVNSDLNERNWSKKVTRKRQEYDDFAESVLMFSLQTVHSRQAIKGIL